MNNKEEFKKLIETIRNNSLAMGIKLKNSDIAERMQMNTAYFATLTGKSGVVTKNHIKKLMKVFDSELQGIKKPAMAGDPLNRERAFIKVLIARVAKLEAARLGLPVDAVLDEIERDTMIAWNDLEKM